MHTNLGEISRHLAGTGIGHRQEDIPYFAQDYPILPVRRRFWEASLRVLDQTGTDSQLRNQLGMVHKVIQSNLDAPLGCVIPADVLYFDSADKLLQARILPRKVHDKTMRWIMGSSEEQILARACGLVFLINKISASNQEVGVRPNVTIIADLMVDDLASGSSLLRNRLPGLLDKCELLMKVGEEYRIQTEESAAWNDDFLSQCSQLANEAHRVDAERDARIRLKFGDVTKKTTLVHGKGKVPRELTLVFDSHLPPDSDKRLCVWVRDGWAIDENSVRVDARQAGTQSPTIFVFIPKRSADDLRHQLIDYKAASATLDKRGVPNTPEGIEARAAMETTRQSAEKKINGLIEEAFSEARVFQGGGSEASGSSIIEMIEEAATSSLTRLYPRFAVADSEGWDKVYAKAKQGAPDALKSIGYDGEPAKNPVCKAIMAFIAGGKKGADIRANFEGPPYGWSRDTVDGGLQVLLIAGLVRAQDDRGQRVDPRELERKAVGKATLKVESTTVTTSQRIQIRKVFQRIGVQAKQGEEVSFVPEFLKRITEMAESAGGEAPKPARPDMSFIEEIRLASGNEQLLAIYNRCDELRADMDKWEDQTARIEKRWPAWITLKRLLDHAVDIPDVEVIRAQVSAIEKQRQLLEEPDLITPLAASITQILREELNLAKDKWEMEWDAGEARLAKDDNWSRLEREQKHILRKRHGLTELAKPDIKVENTDAVLKTLSDTPFSVLSDRIAAMPGRYSQMLLDAARLLEPEIQDVRLPRRILKSESEIDAWLSEARVILIEKLKKGPVMP